MTFLRSNAAHRLFWALVLTMQLAVFALSLLAMTVSPVGGLLGALFQGLLCLPPLQLLLQRTFLPEGFWTGFLGVTVASTVVLVPLLLMHAGGMLLMPSLAGDSLLYAGLGLFAVEQLACVLALFVLVFASPHLWKTPA